MDQKEFAAQALEECCNPETTTRYGSEQGYPFWNYNSDMFMYVPAFHFYTARGCNKYLFRAVDENNVEHTFYANESTALLTPIWRELPVGKVQLTVTGIKPDGTEYGVVGARVFYKSPSFPEKTPDKARSYKESAIKGYRFAMKQPFIQHWLKNGTPDPSYDLNSYPSKMISALVNAMITYSGLFPEESEQAMKVARSAADYLISITKRGDAPLHDLPPTYHVDFCPDPEKYGVSSPNWNLANSRLGTMMMFYPASAGSMYVALEQATGEKKYLDEACKIAAYYRDTQLENGSWYLVRSEITGEVVCSNFVAPIGEIVPFMMKLYKRTGEKCWKDVAEKALVYVEKTQLATYNWEGQFEDTAPACNYSNLTHFAAVYLAKYYAEYKSDDPEKLRIAQELMRYVEDQFVIWDRPCPLSRFIPEQNTTYDTSLWITPAGLEQYAWYVPIDSSTSHIASGFLALYRAGCGDINLAKAKALMNSVTVAQHEDGKIPTHWMRTEESERNFWFNCMFFSCRVLAEISEYDD